MWKSLVDDSPELQYRVELFAAGMVDTEPGGGNVYDALTKLREHESAWNKFEPLHQFESSSTSYHVNRNILAEILDDRIVFRQISAAPRWGFPAQWEIATGFKCGMVRVYPEEDLLVVSEFEYVVSC